MFKLRRNPNVLVLLRDRECRQVPSAQQTTLNILSQVIRWKTTSYKQVWKHVCHKPALCEDGKIYLHDYNVCLSLWGTGNVPYPLYDLKIRGRGNKIIDALVCSQRHPASGAPPVDRPETYRGAFVSLDDKNWVRSYDHESGKVLQEIYLGEPEKLSKFRHCDWETYPTQITVMKIFSAVNSRQSQSKFRGKLIDHGDDSAIIAVFTSFPLEFRAMMVIKNSVFGPKLSKVNVTEGTLIVGKGSSKDCEICIYNFREMLERNITYKTKLNEMCPQFGDKVVGSYPAGLPINCVITNVPPVLFTVRCSDYNVKFGLVPLHYIINLPKSPAFELRRLSDNEVPKNSQFPLSCDTFERESIHFHYDESNRIIYEKPYNIDIFRYVPETSSIERMFTFSFDNTGEQPWAAEKKSTLQVLGKLDARARSSRWPKNRLVPVPDITTYFTVTRSVMCMDYENELDMIAVLGFCSADARCEGIINVYDNCTGRIIKSMYANLLIDDLVDYSLLFHLDTIVLMEGVMFPRCKCIVYKLSEKNRHVTSVVQEECEK